MVVLCFLLLQLSLSFEGPLTDLLGIRTVHPSRILSSLFLLYWCYSTLIYYTPMSEVFGPLLVRFKLMLFRDFTNFIIVVGLVMLRSFFKVFFCKKNNSKRISHILKLIANTDSCFMIFSSAVAMYALIYPDRPASWSSLRSSLPSISYSLYSTDLSCKLIFILLSLTVMIIFTQIWLLIPAATFPSPSARIRLSALPISTVIPTHSALPFQRQRTSYSLNISSLSR